MAPLCRSSSAKRFFALVQLVTFLPGCSTWEVQSASPADVLENQHPNAVRVTRSDSSRITLQKPEISGDTLYGTVGDYGMQREPRTAVAVSDVDHVEVPRVNGTNTALVGLGIAAATFGVLCVTIAGVCFPEPD